MSKELIISAAPHETRVAILEEGQLCEIYIERAKEFALVGSIYKGRVTRVLPGMQSAFVDIGLDGDAFLYVSDVFENLEEYDHAPIGEQKFERAEEPSTAPFSPEPSSDAPPAALAAPAAESDAGPDAGSHIEPLPGETIGSGGSGPRESGERPPSRNFESQGRREGPYRDQGRDRGGPRGRDRWGRRGARGGRGGRGGRQGRDLPPSKYASPHSGAPRGDRENRGPERFDRPEQPARERYDRPPQEEPFVLPGESLAKYKERASSLPSVPSSLPSEPPAAEPSSEAPSEAPARVGEAPGYRKGSYTGLPSWVLADPSVAPAEEHSETSEAIEAPSAANASAEETEVEDRDLSPKAEAVPQFEEPREEAYPAPTEVSEEPHTPHADHDLSDEDVNALAEQLAQAKHEEMHAEADADALSGGAEFEEENHRAEPVLDAGSETAGQEAAGFETETELESELDNSEEPDTIEAADSALPAPEGSDEILLPGEVRTPRPSAPDDAPRSARIEERPRARFQRPMRRGGRPQRGGGRGPQYRRPGSGPDRRHFAPARRPQLISEMLKAGQEIIVQIAKEPLGKKGARITSHVALPGRFLVYMPTIQHIGVSRKIASAENRSRLRRLVSEARGSYPGGFIVRTAAGGASDEDIRTDIDFLGKTWNEIKSKSESRKAPALMHRDLNLVERILRDYVSEDYTAIWIDNEEEYGKVLEFVGRFQPKLVNRVKLFTKDAPIFEEFGIQHELDKALRPKVWLKSGGYIVINHTEALVAIDVNTGKFVGKGSTRLEDTIVKTNIEAVKEIVRQIRLRDLGGIIVVDFIDMEERRNREKVLGALQQALESDKAPSKVLSFNEFGLVAITRKRTKQALERVLCQPCPYCTGSGMVKSIPTICYEIQSEARKMAPDHEAPNLTLRVHPEIAKALKTRESALIEELEQNARKQVIIQSDATLHWEQYDIY
jgi:Rne/Rng family ribonuclease